MEECVTITKIKVKEEAYFLKVSWADNITLTLVNKDQYWIGILTRDKIKYFYTHLNISEEQYIKNAKKALSGESLPSEFSINFLNNKFTWEKGIESTLKMKHGTVDMLEYSPHGGTELVVDELLKLQCNTEKKLRVKEDELHSVANQLNILVGKFKDSVDAKTKMEEDLYARFLELINAKKRKISEYEEFLNKLASAGTIQ